MNLILFGYKASGKTFFGKKIAKELHRKFIDTDDLILKAYAKEFKEKKTIKEIYKELGSGPFRELESKALRLLEKENNAIISLGGGAVLKPQNIEFLQSIGALVFLKASVKILKERIFSKELPIFFDTQNPEQSFYEMIHERDPIYRSIPAREVDTDSLDEAGIIAALHSILLLEDPPNGF